ncbi:DNA-3-methyladenine glycosylase family protein [Jatrophihabitans sp. YIM 134969]
MTTRTYRPSAPLDLRATLAPLVRGRGDPAHRWVGGTFVRVTRTVSGPATLALAQLADGSVTADAWGPGADDVLGGVPALLGEGDDWSTLDVSAVPVLDQVRRSRLGMRLTRTGLVLDALVPAILEQKVTGGEARSAWRSLLYRYGEPAPGPATVVPESMRTPPTPATIREVPTWDWHRFGVDAKRMRAIRAVCAVAARLEECAAMTSAAASARLQLLPGIGAWTAAETIQRALGCPDTVSVGDFHIPNSVVHVLTGRARGSDEEMLAALEPWRGQRQRVVRLVEASGIRAPKYGPRYAPQDLRAL